MDLRRFATLILAWWWLLLLAIVIAGGSGYFISKLLPKTYHATTTLLVNQSQSTSGLDYNSILMSERLASTYADLAQKPPALQATIKKLGLALDEDRLRKLISVKVVRNTQLLEIAADNESPELSRDIANTLADVFIAQRTAEQSGQTVDANAVLNRQIADVQADIKATTQELEKARASSTPTPQTDIVRLQNLLAQQQTTYSELIKSQAGIVLAEARSTNSLIVVVPAEVPKLPAGPNVMQNTTLAAVIGFLLAFGAIMLVEYVDDTVKSESDIQQATGLATLALIPKDHASKEKNGEPRPYRPPDNEPSGVFGEAFRLLRTNVDFAWAGNPGKTVLVTSSRPGEGKSTTVLNLAVALARDNRQVIIIDGDLRRPTLHRTFGLSNERGLTNALADPRLSAASLLQSSGTPGLNLLTSGPIPPNPSELLGSSRLAEIFAEFAAVADVILVDAPPILGLADSSILSTRVDGVILVSEAGGTRLELLAQAVATIERAGARRLGVVLNKISERSSSYGAYYHSHYYHSPATGTSE